MSHKLIKGFGLVLAVICALILIGYLSVNSLVEAKLKATINRLPTSVTFNYALLDVNVFDGTLAIYNPELILNEGVKGNVMLHVKLEDFKLANVSFWDYVVKNTIHLDTILFDNSKISYVKGGEAERDSLTSSEIKSKAAKRKKAFNKVVKVDHFHLNHAALTIFETTRDSVFLKSNNINIDFKDILFDASTANDAIPFKYSDYEILTDSIRFKVSDYDMLSLGAVSLKQNAWLFNNFKMETLYSKKELSEILEKERDHFIIQIDSLRINHPEFGFNGDRFYFKSEHFQVFKPDVNIYRDKLVADDNTIKPLYTEMLRKLSFDLRLDKVVLENGNIRYQERVKPYIKPGEVTFSAFKASIQNLGNTYKSPEKTTMEIHAMFMESAPLFANWVMDVNSETDDFSFNTEIDNLWANQLNAFTEPNVNIKLEGKFDKVLAAIKGNADHSTMNFKVKYKNMKVQILNKKHQNNMVLTSLANIFLTKDSNKNGNGYISKQGYVQRDKTKSVFNFFWLNMKEGLKLVFIGNHNFKS